MVTPPDAIAEAKSRVKLSFMTPISLLLLGTLGVGARYVTELFIRMQGLPLATFIVNVVGCFIAGFVATTQSLSGDAKTALLIGLCGGFTTFSALILQTLQMFRNGEFVKGFCYLLMSQALGLLAAWAGMKVSES